MVFNSFNPGGYLGYLVGVAIQVYKISCTFGYKTSCTFWLYLCDVYLVLSSELYLYHLLKHVVISAYGSEE